MLIDIPPGMEETPTSSSEGVKLGLLQAMENGEFYIENDEIDSYESQLGLRTTPRSKPAEGVNAFGTEIGRARADGRFRCIRYVQLENEPACMICIDVTLNIGPDREIKALHVEMAVGSEKSKARKNGKKDKRSGNKEGDAEDVKAGKEGSSQKSPAGIVRPEIVDEGWGPELLHGIEKSVDGRTAYNLQSELNFPGGGFKTPSLEKEGKHTEEHRWELVGMRRHDDAGCDRGYRIVEWTLSGKKLTRTTMPRKFRLGLFVEHGNLPFDLDFRYIGSLIAGKKKLEFGWTRGQRVFHFDPPEGAVEVVRKEDLQKLLDEVNGIYGVQ